jgi:hypothetical protein
MCSSFLRTCAYRFHTQREFPEAISANQDSALADLQRVHMSLYVDVLGVSDELQGNCAVLSQVPAQRIVQQQVKSALAERGSVSALWRAHVVTVLHQLD